MLISMLQLKILLAPPKINTDKAMPIRRAGLLTRLPEWHRRDGVTVEESCEDELNEVDKEDVIESNYEGVFFAGKIPSMPTNDIGPAAQYKGEEV